jgi:hypothetical protein
MQNVKRRGDTAVAAGGFADIFRGAVLEDSGKHLHEVALKVFRVFEKDSQNRKVYAVWNQVLAYFHCRIDRPAGSMSRGTALESAGS